MIYCISLDILYVQKANVIMIISDNKKNHQILVTSILFYPITLGGRRGTTDEFATIPFHLESVSEGFPSYF